MSALLPELVVRRPVYQQDDLHRLSQYSKPNTPLSQTISSKVQNINSHNCLKSTIPILGWLPKYKFKTDILGDVIAGITVAVMHIPQGMAYAFLGNVPPIVGIYMAFFPVLVYFIFGTSRHNSMGTFAVVSMMVGKVVLSHTNVPVEVGNATLSNLSELSTDPGKIFYTPTEVATAVTFAVATIQLAMYFLRLGVISSLLSETLVSGFTTAAAIHVLTSQIKDLFGLRLTKRKGVFKVILTYFDIFKNIDSINIAAVALSVITIIVIVFNNEVIKPRLSKRCSFPVPIEMIVVVFGTLLSVQMDLAGIYNIVTVGDIPVGLPEPKLPPFSLVPDVILDSFVITMVAYTISMSMALIFAQKMNYEVDSNQELMAQGLGNLVGSLFSCMPFCASLSRSLIQQTVGGRTQLASFISCGILLLVLLWIGPFFQPLPRCVLAGIIVVALKGMLMQVSQFIKFWRLSKVDATIWMSTFLTVIIFDVEYGLLIGALLCLANLLKLSMTPHTCTLGLVPGTEFYLDTKRYKGAMELPGITIFHYCGGLNFASRQTFRNKVYKAAGVIPQKELARRLKESTFEEKKAEGYDNAAFEAGTCSSSEELTSTNISCSLNDLKLKVLVLDLSSLGHIDPAGVATLRGLVDDYAKIDIRIYFSGCSGPVYETMRKCNAIESNADHFTMFPTVNDAVNFARHKNEIPPTHIWNSSQTHIGEHYISRM